MYKQTCISRLEIETVIKLIRTPVCRYKNSRIANRQTTCVEVGVYILLFLLRKSGKRATIYMLKLNIIEFKTYI